MKTSKFASMPGCRLLTADEFKYLYAFSDPVKYLEFIPWKDLRQRHQDQSDHSLLWRSEKSVQHDHHFHSEEEVFKFCIENDFYFPGHLSEGVLVFEPRALKSSRLLTEMKQFWEAWVIQVSVDWLFRKQTNKLVRMTAPSHRIRRVESGIYLRQSPAWSSESFITRRAIKQP